MTRALISQAMQSGLFFGAYALLLNYSGVGGNLRSAVWCLIALVGVAPFAFASGLGPLVSANWFALGGAGILGAAALLQMNGFFAGAPTKEVGTLLFVVMNVTQISTTAIYFLWVSNWSITLDKAIGLAGAPVIIWLLLR
ncbi:MAG: hypothetical protein Q7S49_00660 [bacterium]|nr:hypothetical protein [bacterium]